MSKHLKETISAHWDELCSYVVEGLRLPNHPHFDRLGTDRLVDNVRDLLNAFVASLDATDALFVEHVEHLAIERAAEGFLLHEIQDALTAVESCLWELVVENLPRDEQIAALSRVSTTVGRAKDALALAFLQQMKQCESELARLHRGLGVLARGTITGQVHEGD